MATIILALPDLGAAMPLQEGMEALGHMVRWIGESSDGPHDASLRCDLVVLDADREEFAAAAQAWKKHIPPPALLAVGSNQEAKGRTKSSRIAFLPANADATLLEKSVAHCLRFRFAAEMSANYAAALLNLPPSQTAQEALAAIVKGSREVAQQVVQECLRWHASDYISVDLVAIANMRKQRLLLVPEIEFLAKMDGTKTVRFLAASAGPEALQVGRLIWGLVSGGVAQLSHEPLPENNAECLHLYWTRHHLLTRTARMQKATHYEVLEVDRNAPPEQIDYAARVLALRFSPTSLEDLDLADRASLVEPLWNQILSARAILMDLVDRANYDDRIEKERGRIDAPWAFCEGDPDVALEFYRRGQSALVSGEAFKAVSSMAGACRNHPDHPVYEASLCWARLRAEIERGGERAELARKERATAEEFYWGRRPWPQALVALALLCTSDGDPKAAGYHLREALRIDPNQPAAKQLLGRLASS